ncbi:phosphonate metabolism protein PhnP [Pectobacteriaceae bacterium CE70]|nr:phosphonate metabolism protein PhnP [Pectobacteriaceae bacterium C52]WJV68993.1 phosphonate metabolism protein PhnP [Pectobacteriaceae bacterium CE70]WJY12931.1 phosphonate metabolism protein PhnP [Pectobacteriaceae bacterium C80]
MEFTFLGTGDVRQVPVFGCDCPACVRAQREYRYRRGPCSASIRCGDETTLLDAGLPRLEQRFSPGEISHIVLTHYHMDHVQGLFSLRWGIGEKIPVYGPPDMQGCDDLYKHPGMLDFKPFLTPFQTLRLGELRVTPLPLNHSRPTFGYLLEDTHQTLAYLTDTIGLPTETFRYLSERALTHLIVDCSAAPCEPPPRNHNDLTRALAIHEALNPAQTWLTHLSHEMDSWLMMHTLPDRVATAGDGLILHA